MAARGASFSDTTSPGLPFVCSSLSVSVGGVNVSGDFAGGLGNGVLAAAGPSIPVSVNAGHPGSPARGNAGLELLGGAFVLAALGGLGGSALRRRRLDV